MMNKIQMAAKLYDTRDTMKKFWKDEYAAKIAAYKPYIEKAMKKYDCDVIPAMIKIVENLQKECPGVGEMSQALIIAAAVEMVDGRR